jgi:hypothetical protein
VDPDDSVASAGRCGFAPDRRLGDICGQETFVLLAA